MIKTWYSSFLSLLTKRLLPLWFLILIWWSLFTFWVNNHIDSFASDYMISYDEIPWVSEAVIILWAKVYANWALWAIVRDRTDMAIKIYKGWKAKKILVSADNSTRNYNETKAIYDYLVDQGIPHYDIFLDFAGFDTYDSMYRAVSNFQVRTLLIPNHINYCPRSVYIARHVGMDSYCVTMPKWFKPRTLWGYYRETFAKIKARLNVLLWSKAYFAGSDTYPINWTWNADMFY